MNADVAARYLRPGLLQLPELPPLSLYVHLPWCLRKCPYCDFNSHEWVAPKTPAASSPQGGASGLGRPGAGWAPKTPAASSPQGGASGLGRPGAGPVPITPISERRELPEQAYLDALRADLEAALPLVWGRAVQSVFIGGGTPSLFSPAGIERLLSDVRLLLPLAPGCEITMEANPGTFERDRFRAFRQAGVTRLSIGVQSFDDAHLKALGRVHDSAQALAAAAEAAAAFDTFNLDLMYALPGQSLDGLASDLAQALAMNPTHLSVYHLTIEPNTVFASRPPARLPDDDTAAEMLDLITSTTATQHLQRYEVSAYAKPGHRCVHNLNYWQFGDYLGIGAGAHSKLSFPHRVMRQVRWREPAMYMVKAMAGAAVSNDDEVSRKALPFEFMLNALRLRDGFELDLYRARTGLPISTLEAALAQGVDKGLLEADLHHVKPTERGFDFLSDLQGLFL